MTPEQQFAADYRALRQFGLTPVKSFQVALDAQTGDTLARGWIDAAKRLIAGDLPSAVDNFVAELKK